MNTGRPARGSLARILASVACMGLCCAAVVCTAGCSQNIYDTDIVSADLSAVRRLTESNKEDYALFVDSRSAEAYAAGHIPGAVNVRLTDLPADGSRVPPHLSRYKNLIVYGDNPGSASARALAKRLILAGHKGVYWYEGGVADWKRSGRELTK